MNKIIIFVLIVLISSCCKRENKYRYNHIEEVYLFNKTNSILVATIENNVGKDTLYAFPNDSSYAKFEKIVNNYNETGVSVPNVELFNVSDTTYIFFDDDKIFDLYFLSYIPPTKKDTIFKNAWRFKWYDDLASIKLYGGKCFLTVTDELLSVMEKDASMLIKFKKFYENK